MSAGGSPSPLGAGTSVRRWGSPSMAVPSPTAANVRPPSAAAVVAASGPLVSEAASALDVSAAAAAAAVVTAAGPPPSSAAATTGAFSIDWPFRPLISSNAPPVVGASAASAAAAAAAAAATNATDAAALLFYPFLAEERSRRFEIASRPPPLPAIGDASPIVTGIADVGGIIAPGNAAPISAAAVATDHMSATPASLVASDRQVYATAKSLPGSVATSVSQRPASVSSSSSEDPDNTCAICLGKPSNKSFTDACYHFFCFSCLVEWSRIKATCPLCQKPFRTIVHNIKANYEFDQYHIFQQLRVPLGASATSPVIRGTAQTPFPSTSAERRRIYEMGHYARPVSSGRYREATAEFYMNNPAQTHRLIPWLNRELVALLSPSQCVTFVLDLVLAVILRSDIRSIEVHEALDAYLRPHTAHFQHEFYCFASSAHDMVMYDRNVEYEYRPPLSYLEAVERLRRAFERETFERFARDGIVPATGDATLPAIGASGAALSATSQFSPASNGAGSTGHIGFALLHRLGSVSKPGSAGHSAFRPWSPQPGPSRAPPPVSSTSPQPSTSGTQCTPSEACTTVVIVSSSEDSEDDDCQVVKVIKPRSLRTPVLIDLCNESSDDNRPSSPPSSFSEESGDVPPTASERQIVESRDMQRSHHETDVSESDDNDLEHEAASTRRKSVIGAYFPHGSTPRSKHHSETSIDSGTDNGGYEDCEKCVSSHRAHQSERGRTLLRREMSSPTFSRSTSRPYLATGKSIQTSLKDRRRSRSHSSRVHRKKKRKDKG